MPLLLEAPCAARPAPRRRQARLGALPLVMFLAVLLGVHLPAANELNWYHDTVGNLTANFTYDGAGERTQETRNGGDYTSYAYDGWGRLIGLGAHLTGETGGYDVISQSMRDYQGRTVAREEPQYNPPGTVGNVTQLLDTVYLYDGGSPVRRQLQAYDPEGLAEPIGSPSNLTYLRGPDQGGGIGGILYSVQPSGNTTVQHYFGYDGRGDVVAQTDSNGNLTYQAAYNAWGQHSPATPTKGTFIMQAAPGTQEWTASGSKTDRLRMNTKEEDPVGLVNQGQRYYMPELGVFVNEDPLGDVDGSNRFTYVRNNPATHIDPEGLMVPPPPAAEGEGESEGAEDRETQEAFRESEKKGEDENPDMSHDTPVQAAEKDLIVRQNGGLPILTAPGQSPGRGNIAPEGSAEQDKQANEDETQDSKTTRKSPPNPNGSKGAPDHQNAVAKLLDFFRKLFPGDRIQSNQGIPGSNRKPDVSVIAPDGTLKAVGEVARTNKDGSLVPREQAKQNEYNQAGIPSTVMTLPKTPTPPNSSPLTPAPVIPPSASANPAGN